MALIDWIKFVVFIKFKRILIVSLLLHFLTYLIYHVLMIRMCIQYRTRIQKIRICKSITSTADGTEYCNAY